MALKDRISIGMSLPHRSADPIAMAAGLAQVGPAIAELRTLLAQLRRVAAQIEERPNALVTGKSTTEEFKP